MDQKEFKYRLVESTKKLIEFTNSKVTNSISTNVEYLIVPNCRDISEHLNERELEKLKEFNQLKGQLFCLDEVLKLLYDSGLVPLWINAEITLSTKRITIVKLISSRRFRDDKELNHKVSSFPPFHPTVRLPPWGKEGEKFNVNWKHQWMKRKWYALTWKWRYKKARKRTKAQRSASTK